MTVQDRNYARRPCSRWTDSVLTWGEDDVAVLTGTCECCEHRTSYVSRIIWTDGANSTGAEQDQPDVVIQCDCGEEHKGREEANGRGCGGYWSWPEPQK